MINFGVQLNRNVQFILSRIEFIFNFLKKKVSRIKTNNIETEREREKEKSKIFKIEQKIVRPNI